MARGMVSQAAYSIEWHRMPVRWIMLQGCRCSVHPQYGSCQHLVCCPTSYKPCKQSASVPSTLAGLPHKEGRVREVLEQRVVAARRCGHWDAGKPLHEVFACHGAAGHPCTSTPIPILHAQHEGTPMKRASAVAHVVTPDLPDLAHVPWPPARTSAPAWRNPWGRRCPQLPTAPGRCRDPWPGRPPVLRIKPCLNE